MKELKINEKFKYALEDFKFKKNNNGYKTKKLLDDAIAIPIFYRKNLNFYTTLAKKINKIQWQI